MSIKDIDVIVTDEACKEVEQNLAQYNQKVKIIWPSK
jgi:hypothetical protein